MVGGGLAAAQAPPATADDHAAHHPAKASPAAPPAAAKSAPGPAAKGAPKGDATMGGGMSGMCPMMGGGMMGGGMMGGGMMGGGMMGGGMGPMSMMGGAATRVDVKKIDKGVTITLTASDAASAARLQKMAEAMRLMHEATAP
jgi:hypothetical protein